MIYWPSISSATTTTTVKSVQCNHLPIFLYGSECWAVTKRDVLKIDALDQWCLRRLLGIKWYHHVRNDEVRRTTTPVGHCPSMASFSVRPHCKYARRDRCQDRSTITASPSENWRRPPGRPQTTWMKTIQQDLRSNNLSLDEVILWLRIVQSGD